MNITEIPLEDIGEDSFFCFTRQWISPKLYNSVLQSGIRTPIRLHSHQGRYRMISGFKRIAICRTLGWKSVPAELVDEIGVAEVFSHVIHEQSALFPLTLVEKARGIGICEALGMKRDRITEEILPVLDLPFRRDLFDQLQKIRELPDFVQIYLEQFDISLKKAGMFSGWADGELKNIIRMADTLQLRPEELSRIILMIHDIGKRESLSFEEIYKDCRLDSLIGSALSRNERIQELKTRLKTRRFPRLVHWQNTLETSRKALNLPASLRLFWDENLEAPGVVLQARLQTEQDIQALDVFIHNSKNQKRIEEMFEIV